MISRIKYLILNPIRLYWHLETLLIKLFSFIFGIRPIIIGTKNIDPKVTFKIWFVQKVVGYNRHAYWPMHHSSIVTFPMNVLIGKDTNPGYNPGCFIHGVNKIIIGDYTKIAPNVGLMSGNHDIRNLSIQTSSPSIIIGKYCWIGMNSIILQGVVLGDHTVVAAGAVVNKSYPDGHVVLGGVPAKVIKLLKKEECVDFEMETTYVGYIKEKDFDEYKKNKIYV